MATCLKVISLLQERPTLTWQSYKRKAFTKRRTFLRVFFFVLFYVAFLSMLFYDMLSAKNIIYFQGHVKAADFLAKKNRCPIFYFCIFLEKLFNQTFYHHCNELVHGIKIRDTFKCFNQSSFYGYVSYVNSLVLVIS